MVGSPRWLERLWLCLSTDLIFLSCGTLFYDNVSAERAKFPISCEILRALQRNCRKIRSGIVLLETVFWRVLKYGDKWGCIIILMYRWMSKFYHSLRCLVKDSSQKTTPSILHSKASLLSNIWRWCWWLITVRKKTFVCPWTYSWIFLMSFTIFFGTLPQSASTSVHLIVNFYVCVWFSMSLSIYICS